jgi:hypothetical protein
VLGGGQGVHVSVGDLEEAHVVLEVEAGLVGARGARRREPDALEADEDREKS